MRVPGAELNSDKKEKAMWIILAIFAASFAVVAVLAFTIAWAMEAKRELESWKRKHRRMVEAENAATWHANRQMIIS